MSERGSELQRDCRLQSRAAGSQAAGWRPHTEPVGCGSAADATLSSKQVRLQNNVRRLILKNILAKTPNKTEKTSCMLPECVCVGAEKGPGRSPVSCRGVLSGGLLAAGVAEEGHAGVNN